MFKNIYIIAFMVFCLNPQINAQELLVKDMMRTISKVESRCNIEKFLKQCASGVGNNKPIVGFTVDIDGLTKDNFQVGKKGNFAHIKLVNHTIEKPVKGTITVSYEDGTNQIIEVSVTTTDNIEKSKRAVSGLKSILSEFKQHN